MKIYFAGSIRAGRQDKELYGMIVDLLRCYGQVLTEHVGDLTLSDVGDDGPSDSYIYERDMAWLREADILVAEVTVPSLGVGYEIAMAEKEGKAVLCLYRPQPDRKLSAMLAGDSYIVLKEYQTMTEVEEVLKEFMGVRI
jgi:nucleoside 2-deoxyribosyltransferase